MSLLAPHQGQQDSKSGRPHSPGTGQYLGGILGWFAVPLLIHPTFTGIGHYSAMLIGLTAYPITRRRKMPEWNPAALWRRRVRVHRRGA
ncbi:rhomboid-like protein [Nocardia niwae]|uniref:Rhomboid-like protein n=1 Tax=Nocardia niwae TaxID=626084 RepID=A0ABV2X7U4_9NOCA